MSSLLKTINKKTLENPVRLALKRKTVKIAEWKLSRGGRVGNPVSSGLYRFSGLCFDKYKLIPWSIVLKIIQKPNNLAGVNIGAGFDETHWNYWKREIYAYKSGILDKLPEGLSAPCCFGIEERPDNIFWLWLEDVADIYDGSWPVDRYAIAARHLGRFSGVNLCRFSQLPKRWFSFGLLRQWCNVLNTIKDIYDDDNLNWETWKHVVRTQLYLPASDLFWNFIEERERFLNALDRLPQTLCHRDASPNNLIARIDGEGRDETVLIDWALSGIGPVGEEIAQLASGAILNIKNVKLEKISELIFNHYLEGLRETGWHGDIKDVRFGYVSSAALRGGLWFLWSLLKSSDAIQRCKEIETRRNLVKKLSRQQETSFRFLLQLAEEAFKLLNPSV